MTEQSLATKAPVAAPVGTLGERIFIVPRAHTELGDVSFQLEMYELFHRTAGGRIGHMVGTPAVLFGVLMLLSRLPGIAAPLAAGALVLGIAVWGWIVDRLAGLVTALVGAGLAAGAALAAAALGAHVTLAGVLCVAIGCFVQTFSHLFEEVPPPQSGSSEFVPVRAWLRALRPADALRSTLLTFAVFYWLELWAALRILPIQMLHLLMRAGHRPELRRALDQRVREILASPAGDWRRPRAREASR